MKLWYYKQGCPKIITSILSKIEKTYILKKVSNESVNFIYILRSQQILKHILSASVLALTEKKNMRCRSSIMFLWIKIESLSASIKSCFSWFSKVTKNDWHRAEFSIFYFRLINIRLSHLSYLHSVVLGPIFLSFKSLQDHFLICTSFYLNLLQHYQIFFTLGLFPWLKIAERALLFLGQKK